VVVPPRQEQSVPRRTYDRPVHEPARYTLLDLFAGCGGMTRGFYDTDRFRTVRAVEMDPSAAETYGANFGFDHVMNWPIEGVRDFPQVDVVIGGPPCQAFSTLNRSAVGFERRSLWREYFRALKASRPAAFVMENVPQLLTSPEFDEFRKGAEGELGFTVRSGVVNAADFGVPQVRRRAIVIGVLDGQAPWPTQTHFDPSKPIPEGGLPWRTFRDAVAGLPHLPTGKGWHLARNPQPKSLIRYQHVPHDGGDRFAMQVSLDAAGLGHLVPRCWRNKPTGTTDVFGRLRWDRPACTIRTEFYKPEKGRYLHPEADRPITIREAARCMSFLDTFEFPETQKWTDVARQIGNAVPPDLARAIATNLAAALDNPLLAAPAVRAA
jgi:DNA (cytosine-5)-methyltransferase 1